MKTYKFRCDVWVQGESLTDALEQLHSEVQYHFGLDNNLVALESDQGELVEEAQDDTKD